MSYDPIEETVAAGKSLRIPFSGGRFLKILECNQEHFDITINPPASEEWAHAGSKWGPLPRSVKYIRIDNPHASSLTVRLAVSDANFDDQSVTGTVTVSGTVASESPNTLTPHEDVSCGAGAVKIVLAANGDRVEAILVSLDTNLHTLRIGSDGVVPTATKGTPFPPGGTWVLTTTDGVQVWNPGGAACTVCPAETERA